jgi:hypothetical protein
MSHPPDPALHVSVVRTGGIAGIVRCWQVSAGADDAPRWAALISACPWESASPAAPPEGADRFAWELTAELDDEVLRAELADQQLTGPWSTLVDAVRDAQ